MWVLFFWRLFFARHCMRLCRLWALLHSSEDSLYFSWQLLTLLNLHLIVSGSSDLIFCWIYLSLTGTLVSQGQAETSVDTPRIRDAFPLAFFPPGLSPVPLTPACAFPAIPPARKTERRLSVAFYLPLPPALCVQHAPQDGNVPLSQSVAFLCRIPGSSLEGRGVGGAGVFIAQSRDCGQWEGRPVAVSHHRAGSTALRSWGFIWNFTKSLFPLQRRAGGTGVTCLSCVCGFHIRGGSMYRYEHFILKCR